MKILTKRYGTIGWEEFLQTKKDILSEYDSVKEKTKNRPVKTEHGNAGEAGFRKWLTDFLPEKYGVTSGYIIPDLRATEYSVRHFDVIVYDKVNSPVLWAETTLDKSEHGKRRAIPAKFVHSVFEVKSALNNKSIGEALEKLKEANDFAGNLNKTYTSAIVFIEVKSEIQKNCMLVEKLFRNDISGYYGGVILRAEKLDDNLAGYFQFIDSGKTEKHMPLVKDIGGLTINDQNNPVLTERGDTCEAIALENKWNFDKGYSPLVKNVHLCWSYNGFPNFAIDVLDRLNGEYDTQTRKKKMFYGMSFFRI